MRKKYKKLFAFTLVAIYSIFLIGSCYANANLEEKTIKVTYDSKHLLGNTTNASDNQVVNVGGENTNVWSSDGVKVSKTIDGTNTEDYFDITLQIKSKNDVKTIMSKDSATVVFVLDLSGTMYNAINGGATNDYKKRKVTKAIEAVQIFAREFNKKSANYPNNKIGAVGFNTNGVDLVGLTNISNYTTFNSTLNDKTSAELSKSVGTWKEYTNIEAGLKKAQTMLNGSTSKYKYIIFLSDGMPTTYIKSEYTGYNPEKELTDGLNKGLALSGFGSNYSDTGAIKARQIAMNLKNKGVTIYSIGVGLNTFTGWPGTNAPYKNIVNGKMNGEQLLVNELSRSVLAEKARSIENNFSNITNGNTGLDAWKKYRSDIYNLDWEIRRNYSSYANYYWNGSGTPKMYGALSENETTTDNRDLFKQWIKYGIGSGKYYAVDNDSQFESVTREILDILDDDINNKRTDLWTTVDPMTTYGTPTSEFIEFKGFINSAGKLVQSLSGTHALNGNNTAEFNKTTTDPSGTINWNLKKSGYTTTTENGKTIYVYTLKYRVRLKVEKQGFNDKISYDTNGKTTLTYINENETVKKLDYPIPKVKGFLEDLKITKKVEGLAAGKTFTSANNSFTFTVNFKDSSNKEVGNTFTYDKYDSRGNVIAANQPIKDGNTFTLSNGEYVIIQKLYHDIKWSVVETKKDGFKSSITSVNPKNITISGNTASGTTASSVPHNEVNYKNQAYQLKLNKYDGDSNEKLAGVKFTLYSALDLLGQPTNPVTNMNGELLVNLETDSNGYIDFGNLSFAANGSTTYYLKEVDTIDKYSLLDKYIKIVVNENGITSSYDGDDFNGTNLSIKTNKNENIYEMNVPNVIGIDLPETGGKGGLLFTLIGTMLISYACIRYKKLKHL